MRKYLSLFIFLVCNMAQAATWNVNSSQNTSTIQGIINGAAVNDTVSFAAGTYSTTGAFTLKCGLNYTGPVATPSTVIFSSTFSQSDAIFKLFTGGGFANPCTQNTTIQYFNFKNSGGVYVQTSFTNLTIVHNQFSNIPCCNGPIPGTTGVYFDGAQSTSNSAQILSNTLVQWNTIGDAASCLSPASAFADTSSPEGDGAAGACNGILVNTSVNGLTVKNNNFVHVSEGSHITCPGGGHPGTTQPCEPTSNGVTTKNVDFEFNDFVQNHRINFEEQPQTITNVVWKNNSVHDMLIPTAFSFGLSYACCGGGATTPFLNVSSNVIILNVTPVGRYGYGIEAWGKTANYDNNFMESGNVATSIGMAYSFGPVATMNNNTICGQGFASAGYIASEGNGSGIIPPAQSGNITSSTCSAKVSFTPTISPPSGAVTFPLTVTINDTGYTSGNGPLGNTGIWYTIDGSNPVPGAGTAKRLDSGGTFQLNTVATVKAVGMWGAVNQPTSYPSGFGFVPSSPTTASYSGTSVVADPAFSPTSQSFTTTLPVSVSDLTAGADIHCTTNGTTPDVSSPLYTSAFNLSTSTTIKCIAIKSGLSNSNVVSSTYTLKTFSGISIATTGGVTSMTFGTTNQLIPRCTYSDASFDACPSIVVNYVSSSPGVASVGSTSGLVSGLAAGSTTLQANVSGTQSNVVPLSVTSGTPPVLTSCFQGNTTTPVNTLTVGQTPVQQHLFCFYGSVTPTPITNDCSTGDAFGNGPIAWGSTDPTKGTVTPLGGSYPNLGNVVPVAAGPFSSTATATGGILCNRWDWNVSAPTLVSIALSSTGGVTSLTPPNTVQLIATGTYSNATTAPVTGSITSCTSNNPLFATISNSGLVTAVAAGSPTFTCSNGTITSAPPFPLTINALPPPVVINTIQLGGKIKMGGKVKTQ